MATTKPLPQALPPTWREAKMYSLATGALIPKGTLACNDGGVVKALTSTLCQAGALLLGVAAETYDNSGGGSALALPMQFLRGMAITLPKAKAGDVPTAALVGGRVAFDDNETCMATITGTDAVGTLVEILPGGAGYRVEI